MASQAGQDAKFFTRGKIQVRSCRDAVGRRGTAHLTVGRCCAHVGIPRRVAGGGGQGQEVHEAEDGAEEDRREYYDGE